MRVLVTGGGPTGLTLGIDLARRGIAVRVIDKAGTFFNGSRADTIQPRPWKSSTTSACSTPCGTPARPNSRSRCTSAVASSRRAGCPRSTNPPPAGHLG